MIFLQNKNAGKGQEGGISVNEYFKKKLAYCVKREY